ncbi:hypothetical protein QBC38DRAFT_439687 [Podospora fimiseda]|uniref:Uncharacterized protein n=1 Tax=Podospora fimiseda TaxID=252190 RepID=A0AAN7BXV8_9PEZI|nr:hypothetical protein QBC38DRAFT_439687 [Podospora fimiseda]
MQNLDPIPEGLEGNNDTEPVFSRAAEATLPVRYPSGPEVVPESTLEVGQRLPVPLNIIHTRNPEQDLGPLDDGDIEIEKMVEPLCERRIFGLRLKIFWGVVIGLAMFVVVGTIMGCVASVVVGKLAQRVIMIHTPSTGRTSEPLPTKSLSTLTRSAYATPTTSLAPESSLGLPPTVTSNLGRTQTVFPSPKSTLSPTPSLSLTR